MAFQVGEQIGAYVIESPLGYGGMASVYRAYHALLNRYVAVKVIHTNADAGFTVRFEREAQIAASLDHPNIVPIYDYAEANGQPYLVMKLVEGCTLKDALKDGALWLDDILQISERLASALDYAHGLGIAHRDLKPSNVLLDKNGTPYLSDFGLARIISAVDSTISKHMMIGTPHYMAPEQARMDAVIDHRADIYSFGIVLYEMLTGRVPFADGTPYAIINAQIHEPLPAPSSINPAIPPQLELVLYRATAKTAEDRYASAGELFADLRRGIAELDAETRAALNGSTSHTISDSIAKHMADFVPFSSVALSTKKPVPTEPALSKHSKIQGASPAAKRSRIWLWLGGAAAFVSVVGMVVLLTAVFLSANAADNPTVDPAPTAFNQSGNRPAPPPESNWHRLSVPELTVDEAQNGVAQNPDDDVAYLALARAQLGTRIGGAARAGETIAAGYNITFDRLSYQYTAAQLAIEEGHHDLAFLLYAQMMTDSEDTPAYNAVRNLIGQEMYALARQANRLTLAQVRTLRERVEDEQPESRISPLALGYIARGLISTGNVELAGIALRRALSMDGMASELHLVYGELLLAQDNVSEAREEFERVLSNRAPEWVHDRTRELVDTLPA